MAGFGLSTFGLRVALATLFVAPAIAAAVPAAAYAQDEEDDEHSILFQEGIRLLEAKKYDDSVAVFKRCIKLQPKDSAAYYNIACAYSLKGEKAQALDWFEKAIQNGFQGEENLLHLEQDSDLDGIRGEPRFKEIVGKWFPKAKAGETLVTLKGEPASLDKLRGKVVIVDFWRTWVEPCKEGIPELVAIEKDLGPRGVAVVGISDEPVPLQEQIADELKINYMLLRQTGPLPKPFEGIRVFPTKLILDQEGKVVKKIVGSATKEELEDAVKALLAPAPKKDPEGEPQVF
jgi:thiol-disulfide isomerase/thioredoxin